MFRECVLYFPSDGFLKILGKKQEVLNFEITRIIAKCVLNRKIQIIHIEIKYIKT